MIDSTVLEAGTFQVPTSCMFYFILLFKLLLATRTVQIVGLFYGVGRGGHQEITWVASPRAATVLQGTTVPVGVVLSILVSCPTFDKINPLTSPSPIRWKR